MYTIEQAEEMLERISEEIPQEFYNNLNGGVLLLPEAKPHPEGKGDLYVLGEYCRERNLGRYIKIYFGSFMKFYANVPYDVLYAKLKETLLHEFTHHLENQAGDHSLDDADADYMESYRGKQNN